eukprot:403367358
MSEQQNGTVEMKSHKNSQQKKKLKRPLTLKEKCLRICKRTPTDQITIQDPKVQPLRQIVIDTAKLPELPGENHVFMSNRISTTKYNYLTFIPKSLIIQFKRVSNIYFLITAVLCSIPGFSPLPSYSAIIPLAFVLFMSMLREAYEDYSGDKFDRTQALAQLASEGNETCPYKDYFREKLWQDVKCGDIILVQDHQHFPVDAMILLSSADNGECFVQTSTLDGERALKHKQCLVPVKKAIETQGLMDFNCSIHTEIPTKNLYEFNAFLESEQLPEQGTISLTQTSKKRTITMDNKQLALRGSNLANTNWVIAVTVYTGKETKLMLNQGLSRFKQSKIEKVVNVICIYLILIQTVLCVIMSIFSGFYTSNYANFDANGIKRKAEYLFYTEFQSAGSSTNSTNTDDDLNYNPTIVGIKTYGMYYILLNTLIPISLVVSIEFVKLIQTPFFAHDIQMYDEESMKQCQPMTMTLHEELASVKYIFADKTGTLTANIMQFKACTIGSVCYDEDYKEEDYDYVFETNLSQPQSLRNSIHVETINIDGKEFRIPEQNQIEDLEGDGEEKAMQFEQFKKEKGYPFNKEGASIKLNGADQVAKIVWDFKQSTDIIKNLLETKRYFLNDEINLGASQIGHTPLILHKQNEYLHYFWLTVVLCHDVITTKKHDSDELTYQGTSPDEITLLDAAKEVGYIFLDRYSDSMKIEVYGQQKTYRLLQKIEFTSERKKMSVVVQDQETGLILLLTKGADLAIFDKLSVRIEQPFLEATKEDLIKFSTKGFRTLCFAIRVLEESYYKEWAYAFENSKLEMIKLSFNKLKIEMRQENMQQKLLNEIESELFLLGATALEDKLQEGVPEAIEDFNNAGIKVWMLTGDKLETAENIGFSSKMFNEKMYIFKLQTKSKMETRQRLNQIDIKIQEIEKSHCMPIIGTQFILNPNPGNGANFITPQDIFKQQSHDTGEARNIIRALEDFKHESKASEYTLNDSWARRPTLRRKLRKRLEEIVPDKKAIVSRLIRENQINYSSDVNHYKYIPRSFDMANRQYIVRSSNVYRSNSSFTNKSGKESIIDNEDTFGILIEGQTLQYMIDSESMRKKFLKILGKCQAVIVCRASPSQKGLVVQMIKTSEPDIVTLAIGDGANDVNMIQKAHIGIGIFGKEGYQAAGNSDYAIGQFRFLRRLMFVHGRWSGVRLSVFMLFFFHKNLVFTLPQFWFAWYSGFSGQTFYDDIYLTSFNTFVTAIAVCTIAIWDQDLNPSDKKQGSLIELFFPFLYSESMEHDLFSKKKFLAWSIISVLQSVLIFGMPILTYQYLMLDDGMIEDLWAASTCAYFGTVLLHYFLIFTFTRNWTLWIAFMYFMSFLLFIPFVVCTYDAFPNTFMERRLGEIVFSNANFWLQILCMVAACLLPILFYFEAQSLLFPKLKDLILQNTINFQEVNRELNTEIAKQTHELFKQRQQALFHQWEDQYNTFKQPEKEIKFINIINESSQSKIYQDNYGVQSPREDMKKGNISIIDQEVEEINRESDVKKQSKNSIVFQSNSKKIFESPERPSKLRKGMSSSKLVPSGDKKNNILNSKSKLSNKSQLLMNQSKLEDMNKDNFDFSMNYRINDSLKEDVNDNKLASQTKSENLDDNYSVNSRTSNMKKKLSIYIQDLDNSPEKRQDTINELPKSSSRVAPSKTT